ncbi:MAG: hypothetical protein ACRCZF_11775, partial [Gemmataceae bacterium]
GAWNTGNNPGVFQLAVAPGSTVRTRVYIGDSFSKWPGSVVGVESDPANPVSANAPNTTTGYGFVELTGTDFNADGLFTVTIRQTSNAVWVTNGMDFAVNGATLPGLPLRGVAPPVPTPIGEKLTPADLPRLRTEALNRWAMAGLTNAELSKLAAVPLSVIDLGDSDRLGEASATAIVLDDDAAGMGWYIDPDPTTDEPFQGMDALTVLMHEYGHILGHVDYVAVDGQPDTIMTETLAAGVRRSPSLLPSIAADWLPAEEDDRFGPWVG